MKLTFNELEEILNIRNYVHRVRRDAEDASPNSPYSNVKAVCGLRVYLRDPNWRYDQVDAIIDTNVRPCKKCFPQSKGAYSYVPE